MPRASQYLGMVRRVVAMAAERVGFDPEDVDKIELAIDEACSNAVLYGGDGPGLLDVEVVVTPQRFAVTLRDDGEAFDFEGRGNFDLSERNRSVEYGGLGIYIIKNFMDEVSYRHDERGNTLRMAKLRSVGV